jgi:hypothetical protein
MELSKSHIMFAVGDHYTTGYQVGSEFTWIFCTLCVRRTYDQVVGAWPMRFWGYRPIGLDSVTVDQTTIVGILTTLETHTKWHMELLGADEFIWIAPGGEVYDASPQGAKPRQSD